jgi:hypothetical protein
MSKAQHLKKTADLYRRLAAIPTSGGHRADSVLLALADKLDHEARDAQAAHETEATRHTTVTRVR